MASEKNIRIVTSLIEKIGDVPEIFTDGFKYSCMGGEECPYAVHVAKYDEDWYEKSNQLISITDEGVFVFEVVNDQAKLTHYAYEDIIFLKRMDFARTAKLIIKGTSNRKLYESAIEYDIKDKQLFDFITVSVRLKERLPETFQDVKEESLTEDSYELLKLAYFKDSHVKLYNYAVGSLLNDRKIKKTLLQSKVFRKNLLVFRKTDREDPRGDTCRQRAHYNRGRQAQQEEARRQRRRLLVLYTRSEHNCNGHKGRGRLPAHTDHQAQGEGIPGTLLRQQPQAAA